MTRPLQRLTALSAVLLLLSGCYGPFNLTRRLYRWNGQIGDKWEQELIFIVLAWTQIYSLAVTADAIAFNSMEFWTGKNPVDPLSAQARQHERRISRGSDTVVLSRAEEGSAQAMTVQLYRDGAPAGTMTAQRQPGSATTAFDAQGHTLFTAQTMDDGGVTVHDGRGRRVATYSSRDVERVLRTVRHDPR